MLLAFSHGLRDYLWDVFVDRFDFWLAFGIIAQLLFTARFIVQWVASEKAGRSVMPMTFWVFSITGGMMTLLYGLVRREPIIIMGQAFSVFIYLRNVTFVLRERRSKSA